MDRCALFVDAGHVLADGAMAVHGSRRHDSVAWNYAGLLKYFAGLARDQTGLPLLRCYWYEAAADSRRTADHDALADLPGLKLRPGGMRPGRRDGVESGIHRDLTTLAGNKAISDAVVIGSGEDLAPVVAEVQELGVRVLLVHLTADGGWTVSRALRQECDDIMEVSAAQLRPFVDLISGAEPARPYEAEGAGFAADSGSALSSGSALAPGAPGLAESAGNGPVYPVQSPPNGLPARSGAVPQHALPSAAPAAGASYRPGYQRAAPPQAAPTGAPGRAAGPPPAAAAASPGSGQDESTSGQRRMPGRGGEAAGRPGDSRASAPDDQRRSAERPPGLPGSEARGGQAGLAGQQMPGQPLPGSAGGEQAISGAPLRRENIPPANGQPPYPLPQPGSAGSLPPRGTPGGLPREAAPSGQYGGRPDDSVPRSDRNERTGPGQSGAGSGQGGMARGGLDQNALDQNALGQNGMAQRQGSGLPPGGDRQAGRGRGDQPQNGLGPVLRPQNATGPQNGVAGNGLPDQGLYGGSPNGLPGGGLRPAGMQGSGPYADESRNGVAPGGFPPGGQLAGGLPANGVSRGTGQRDAGQRDDQSRPLTSGNGPQYRQDPAARYGSADPYDQADRYGQPERYGSASQYGQDAPPVPFTRYPADSGPSAPAPYAGGGYPAQPAYPGAPGGAAREPALVSVSLTDAVQAAHAEGYRFGDVVAGDAPALWLEAVLARKPRVPSDLEARLLQGSALPVDSLQHDEVRHALRRGFWDALERSRR